MKKTIFMRGVAALIAIIMLFSLAACGQQAQQGEKNITVTVVYEDKTEKDFEI